MKALIAAGGSGTRLRPLTFSSNKHMLPIANKPLILYPIEAIAETGITDVGIVVNETRPAIEALLGNGSTWGLSIRYIDQAKPLGLAHVVKVAKDFIGESPFVYHLGDNIFTKGIMRPFVKFATAKPDALLTMVQHEDNRRLGVPFFDAEGKLEKVVEKPENPPNNFGVPGLYFLSPVVFKAFEGEDQLKPSARGELEIPDLYTYLLNHGYRVETEEVDGRWMDPGKFDDMLEASAYMLAQRKDMTVESTINDTTTLKGNVKIEVGGSITNSTITGPVAIGKRVCLENCQIGPNVTIQDDCYLRGVRVQNSIIMSETEILDPRSVIADSMIGKKTKVWDENMGSTTLFIGDHCSVRLN